MLRARGAVLLLSLAALGGCAGNPYQSYPDSLYAALYENTPEALGEHQALLEEILAWYDQEGQTAPPGVAAELAFYQAKLGQTDRVDELLREAYDAQASAVESGEVDFKGALRVLTVAKHLERIADHATNLAEDVIYLASGEVVKHP